MPEHLYRLPQTLPYCKRVGQYDTTLHDIVSCYTTHRQPTILLFRKVFWIRVSCTIWSSVCDMHLLRGVTFNTRLGFQVRHPLDAAVAPSWLSICANDDSGFAILRSTASIVRNVLLLIHVVCNAFPIFQLEVVRGRKAGRSVIRQSRDRGRGRGRGKEIDTEM